MIAKVGWKLKRKNAGWSACHLTTDMQYTLCGARIPRIHIPVSDRTKTKVCKKCRKIFLDE
jgi:hypothetical protein